MSANNIRWRISEAVRRVMLRTEAKHPLRRAYHVVRTIPGVKRLWRSIDARRPTTRSFERHVAGGGRFGSSIPHDANALPPIVPFDHPDFFPNLMARISACEPELQCQTETVVLINNGLSAGGAERQIVSTMLGLKARGVPAVFVGEYVNSAPGQDFHLRTLLSAGADVRELKRETLPGNSMFEHISQAVAEQLFRIESSMLLEILDMVRTLRAIRPCAVHLWQDMTSVKHALSAMIVRVPRIILSGRNLNPTHFTYYRDYMRPAFLALLDQPSIVLSNNSQAGANSYAAWLGIEPSRIPIVRNGFDFGMWPPADAAKRSQTRLAFGVPNDGILVAGAFRLSPEKRPLLWIETAAEALKHDPHLHFVIAGEGDMLSDVEAHVHRLGLRGRIRLAGRMSDVHALFIACDAFLLTSEQEGIPNVLLEAQWYGRPVLATRAGGAEEALQDRINGHISDDADPKALGLALANLVKDDALRERAQASGPDFIARNFSIDRMIDDTLTLYRA